jgi:hypothetical protein
MAIGALGAANARVGLAISATEAKSCAMGARGRSGVTKTSRERRSASIASLARNRWTYDASPYIAHGNATQGPRAVAG